VIFPPRHHAPDPTNLRVQFQAFRGHQIVNVFDDPGSADLTANVDFAYLKESLAGVGACDSTNSVCLAWLTSTRPPALVALPHGPIAQRDFLMSLGLAPRLDRLLQSAATRERKVEIAQAARRLVDADGMGGEYKFLGVTPPRPEGGAEPVYPFEQSAK
jgi:NADH dehydrogenase [ubiquinone] 1 alpha subcomplex assembly factor 7